MNHPPRTRRTPQQWQAILDTFHASGLSGAEYCRQQQLPYASFSKWRQRLTDKSVSQHGADLPPFIDLNSLNNGHAPSSPWRITLKLGHGIELVLSQP